MKEHPLYSEERVPVLVRLAWSRRQGAWIGGLSEGLVHRFRAEGRRDHARYGFKCHVIQETSDIRQD
jgi:hypothetical protein